MSKDDVIEMQGTVLEALPNVKVVDRVYHSVEFSWGL